jgi:hypothetical protein
MREHRASVRIRHLLHGLAGAKHRPSHTNAMGYETRDVARSYEATTVGERVRAPPAGIDSSPISRSRPDPLQRTRFGPAARTASRHFGCGALKVAGRPRNVSHTKEVSLHMTNGVAVDGVLDGRRISTRGSISPSISAPVRWCGTRVYPDIKETRRQIGREGPFSSIVEVYLFCTCTMAFQRFWRF